MSSSHGFWQQSLTLLTTHQNTDCHCHTRNVVERVNGILTLCFGRQLPRQIPGARVVFKPDIYFINESHIAKQFIFCHRWLIRYSLMGYLGLELFRSNYVLKKYDLGCRPPRRPEKRAKDKISLSFETSYITFHQKQDKLFTPGPFYIIYAWRVFWLKI